MVGSEEIFKLSVEEREELFNEAVGIYTKQIETAALLTEIDFLDFLKKNIHHTELEISNMEGEEYYEVCYFLTEVINRIKDKYKI